MTGSSLTIAAWGNSHGIRLSRELMATLGVAPGTPLQATVVAKGCLELGFSPQRPSLQDKLAVYDPALHGGEAMSDHLQSTPELGLAATPSQQAPVEARQ